MMIIIIIIIIITMRRRPSSRLKMSIDYIGYAEGLTMSKSCKLTHCVFKCYGKPLSYLGLTAN
jgi:hypothetical protein